MCTRWREIASRRPRGEPQCCTTCHCPDTQVAVALMVAVFVQAPSREYGQAWLCWQGVPEVGICSGHVLGACPGIG
jgi:hypothetical protein